MPNMPNMQTKPAGAWVKSKAQDRKVKDMEITGIDYYFEKCKYKARMENRVMGEITFIALLFIV